MMDFDDWWGDDWEGCRASAQGVWDYQQRRIEALEAALQKVMDLGVTFEQMEIAEAALLPGRGDQ